MRPLSAPGGAAGAVAVVGEVLCPDAMGREDVPPVPPSGALEEAVERDAEVGPVACGGRELGAGAGRGWGDGDWGAVGLSGVDWGAGAGLGLAGVGWGGVDCGDVGRGGGFGTTGRDPVEGLATRGRRGMRASLQAADRRSSNIRSCNSQSIG